MRDLVLQPYRAGDEHAICELFATTYGTPLPLEYWRWRFAKAPAGPGVVQLAWAGETLAAHYAVTPVDIVIGGQRVLTGLSGTTMTHPRFRGRGLFPVLARTTYETMVDRFSHVWGFPNTNSHRGFVESLDWKDICEIPFFEADLGPLRLPTDRLPEIEAIPRFPVSIDRLTEGLNRQASVHVARDAAYLNWRFADNPSEDYRILLHGSPQAPNAYAVYKVYADAIQVVDLVHGDDIEPAVRLCEEIARVGRAQVAQRINMWLPLRAPLHRALEKRGFRPGEPVTYLGGLPLRGDASDVLVDPRAWYYAMADSDVY